MGAVQGVRASRFASAEPLYLPPFRVAALSLDAVSRLDRQRLSWERLRKRIHGVVNRANASNAGACALDLLRLNIVRGTGLLCRSLLRAQVVSQNFTPVYAAIVAALNARVPEVGEVVVARVIKQLKRGIEESDRGACVASVKFIAHLFNQSVVDEGLPLEVMNVLIGAVSDDSVELLVVFVKECGAVLGEADPRNLDAVLQSLRRLVQEGEVSTRIQYLVDGLLALKRSGFKGCERVPEELELVPDEDRIIHSSIFGKDDEGETHPELDAFQFEDDWEEAEMRYAEFRLDVLGELDDLLFEDAIADAAEVRDGASVHAGSDVAASGSLPTAASGRGPVVEAKPKDMTEDDVVTFRRKVYLQIMSAVGYEECAHKLAQFMRSYRGQEGELCNMIIECCSQERTFMRYYGLVGKQFCLLNRRYVERFEEAFAEHYSTIHQFGSRKIRNMANFYAFLLCSDAMPWNIFGVVVLSEDETTSSSRIFLMYIVQEISRTLTLPVMKERLQDERLRPYLNGLMPSTVPANMRFAINFFTAIGLGPLTDDIRAKLREIPLQNVAAGAPGAGGRDDDPMSSSSSSSLSSSSSELSPSSYSSGSDAGGRTHHQKRPQSPIHAGRGQMDYRNEEPALKVPRLDGGERNWMRNSGGPPGARVDGARGCGEPVDDLSAGGRGRGRGREHFGGQKSGGVGIRGGGRGRGAQLTVPAWVTEAKKRSEAESRAPVPARARSPPPPPPPRRRGREPSPDPERYRYRDRGRSRSRSPSRTPPRFRDQDRSPSPRRASNGHDFRQRHSPSRSHCSPGKYGRSGRVDNREYDRVGRGGRIDGSGAAESRDERFREIDQVDDRYRGQRERRLSPGRRSAGQDEGRYVRRGMSRSPSPIRSPSRTPERRYDGRDSYYDLDRGNDVSGTRDRRDDQRSHGRDWDDESGKRVRAPVRGRVDDGGYFDRERSGGRR